jgi:hypothetical protein
MKPNDDRARTTGPSRSDAPPRKRFRVERLEERIAPKKKKGGGVVASTGSLSGGTVY